MKILLTAFDPFGGEPLNPALEAVIRIPSAIGGIQVAKQEIPTVFCKSIRVAAAAIDKEKPDAVLCIGQAGGRHGLTPERVAINIDDARIPDNEGNQPIDRPICPDGPPAYFSTLPIKAMTQKIRAAGIPARSCPARIPKTCRQEFQNMTKKPGECRKSSLYGAMVG